MATLALFGTLLALVVAIGARGSRLLTPASPLFSRRPALGIATWTAAITGSRD